MKQMPDKRAETDKRIKASYMNLRTTNPIGSVKAAEICRLAEISRRTFYDCYLDVYDLNDQYENELLAGCLNGFRFTGGIYQDPVLYFNEFSKCLQPVKKELEILGKYREFDQLKKIEAWRVKLAQQEHTEEEAIFLTIVVAGSVALHGRPFRPAVNSERLPDTAEGPMTFMQGKRRIKRVSR